jgi:hypothetical protein
MLQRVVKSGSADHTGRAYDEDLHALPRQRGHRGPTDKMRCTIVW